MRKQSFIALAIVLAVSTTLFILLAFILNIAPSISSSAKAAAAEVITPTVTAIDPFSAFNDLDTSILITGTDFTAELSGTLVLISPTAYLGNMAMMDMTWVSSTSITGTVPWGMDPGGYTLTVINPDGGTGSLTNAFTVKQGIGQWNGGDLFGGEVRQILLKPGDPNTVYAYASGVGLFRSRDAGEHWRFINANFGNPNFTFDPYQPTWLYAYVTGGLFRSKDEGDTWIKLFNTWPDGRNINNIHGRVYPSPYDPQVLFVSSAVDPAFPNPAALGLIKSTDGGASWSIVEVMEGISVQDQSFHPTDPLQMVLATQAGQVFQSTDGGDTWSEVNKPPLSNIGRITYNPFNPSEVWISFAEASGLYKSTDPDFISWQDVTPADFINNDAIFWFINFISADSVYIVRHHSVDGGLTWQQFGPLTSYGEIRVNPDNSQIGYIGDNTYGVQKTLDGGQTWEIKSHGLTGMSAFRIDASKIDPLRVFATFIHWPGVYRSDDGTNSWSFLPIDGSSDVNIAREDPFEPQCIYAVAYTGFYKSADGGQIWSNLGWSTPEPVEGFPNAMEPDPYHPGHLLVGFNIGSDRGQLFSSSDYGTTWQSITVTQEVDLAWVSSIVFHPDTPGLVYLTSGGTGVYRSEDSGNTWERIDDLQQPDMALAVIITIATHPQPMLLVGTGSQYPYRSTDGGATWGHPQNSQGGIRTYMFLDGDSTRLYIAASSGLLFSSDAGDTWERAAGVIGRLNVSALDYAVDVKNDSTILYAATAGGDPGGTLSMVVNPHKESHTMESNLVEAGIYRYVQHIRQTYLPLALR